MSLLRKMGMVLAAFVLLAAGCVTTLPSAVTLNVSAASSMSNALNEINALYTAKNSKVTIVSNYASSGALQTQIEQGAPCDVFLSAAAPQMDNLAAKGLLLDGSRFDLLINRIVLVVPKNSTLGLTSFTDLTKEEVKIIALGDPASVPAGAYARQAFTQLGILSAISAKTPVYGANVTQVLQYVSSGNADAGIVYSTDALSDSNVMVVADGPEEVNNTIVYPAAIIKNSKVAAAAQEYLDFLRGEEARAIFEKYGFALAGA